MYVNDSVKHLYNFKKFKMRFALMHRVILFFFEKEQIFRRPILCQTYGQMKSVHFTMYLCRKIAGICWTFDRNSRVNNQEDLA